MGRRARRSPPGRGWLVIRTMRPRLLPRALIGAALLGGILLPQAGGGATPGIAHAAAAPKLVWQVANRSFDPTNAVDEIDSTFTPTGSTYVVEIQLAGSNNGDEVYAQLGTSNSDATQVTVGEDRFFVASNLVAGHMPRFRVLADPKHAYGGRTLTYATAVYTVPGLPLDVTGVAATTLANILAFKAPVSGSYTIHYTLDSGSAHIIVLDQSNHQQDSGKVSGEGSYTVSLPGGLTAIGLKQAPDSGVAMNWHLIVGQAITVSKLSPANNARLTTPPATLSALAPSGARLVLDHQTVGGVYNAATGAVIYRPATPLPAGEHLLQVAGADGTVAAASSQFVVLPNLSLAPPITPAGTVNGQPWVQTSTPDGLYHLRMPASWRLLSVGTRVALLDPKGSGMVLLDERFLGQSLDALAVARQLSAKLGGTLKVQRAWQFLGGKDKAVFSAVATTSSHPGPLVSVNMVLPSAADYSLLLAYGYGNPTNPVTTTLAGIEGSIGINTLKQTQNSRRYQHYSSDGLTVDYPVGWAANFVESGGSWFAGPQDGALLIAIGRTYTGTGANSTEAQTFAGQVQTLEKSAHPKLVLITSSTSAGVVRWIGAYPTTNGASVVIEIGQAVVGNGHFVGMWGDTPLERAPANLAILQHAMDTAAAGAGLAPPSSLTVDLMIQAVRQAGGSGASATTSNGSGGGGSGTTDYLKSYQKLRNQNFYYQTMNNIMQMQEVTNLNVEANFSDSPWHYEYTPSYGAY